MPIAALLLVVLAAFAHAIWNLLAKRAAMNPHFIWFSSLVETLVVLPLALWALEHSWVQLWWRGAIFLFITGVLELLYAKSLLHGYRVGDLSVVYPLARGTGALLSFVGAILILGEGSSTVAAGGAVLVTSGILVVTSALSKHRRGWSGAWWGVLTGLMIAGYMLVDGYLIRALRVSPILVAYAGHFFRFAALSPGAWRDRAALPDEYRRCWREALGVGVLTPAAFILVLLAIRIAPVSRVAPAREMSMVIGAFLGSQLLNEGHLVRRLTGTALIAAGVAGLALG